MAFDWTFGRFLWAVAGGMYLFLSGFIWYFLRNLLLTYGQVVRNGGQHLSPGSAEISAESIILAQPVGLVALKDNS